MLVAEAVAEDFQSVRVAAPGQGTRGQVLGPVPGAASEECPPTEAARASDSALVAGAEDPITLAEGSGYALDAAVC
jgi:hypothetical protein